MNRPDHGSPRRVFLTDAVRVASSAALVACGAPRTGRVQAPAPAPASDGTWDLSWVDRLSKASDRAVFDWPAIGDPTDPIVLEIAGRYLDGCDAVYGSGRHRAGVVLNVRTQAVPAALADAAWQRYPLGTEFTLKDPDTQQVAARNPFWHRARVAAGQPPAPVSLEELVQRGAIILVCDFALGHLARRLAQRVGAESSAVHRELRGMFVSGAYAVPSGIFGLARAQNAGCAYVRM